MDNYFRLPQEVHNRGDYGMKKIKLLYDVARTMKNMARIDGVATVDVRKDQERVLSLRNTFTKDETGRVKASVSSKMNFNGEDLTRESTTEFNLSQDCQHGPWKMWQHRHGRHGAAGSHGVRGILQGFSLALGVLGSLKVEDQPNGAAVISLDLSDIPDELKTMLREKIQQHHGRHPDFRCMEGCLDVEMLHGLLKITVNERHAIDTLTVNLNGSAQDTENGAHALAAAAELQFAW
jgi:hypothetical protein